MKKKIILLASGVIALASCARPTLLFAINIKLSCVLAQTNPYDVLKGALLFDDGYFGSGLEEVSLPENPIIGDYISIDYTGDLLVEETYPCRYVLKGNVLSYKYMKTTCSRIDINSDTIDSILYDGATILKTEYVVMDQEYTLKSLKDYDLPQIYYTLDAKYYDEHKCPEGAFCGELPLVIAGLYAYNPSL